MLLSSVQPVAINLIILGGGGGRGRRLYRQMFLVSYFTVEKHVVDKMSCFILRHCDYMTGIPKK